MPTPNPHPESLGCPRHKPRSNTPEPALRLAQKLSRTQLNLLGLQVRGRILGKSYWSRDDLINYIYVFSYFVKNTTTPVKNNLHICIFPPQVFSSFQPIISPLFPFSSSLLNVIGNPQKTSILQVLASLSHVSPDYFIQITVKTCKTTSSLFTNEYT